jgi:hypothetical protein
MFGGGVGTLCRSGCTSTFKGTTLDRNRGWALPTITKASLRCHHFRNQPEWGRHGLGGDTWRQSTTRTTTGFQQLRSFGSIGETGLADHQAPVLAPSWGPQDHQVNMVMKFGGSSVASAQRMIEVAQIVLSFQGVFPCVVLSAMGKTTNLLLQAGEEALTTPPGSIPSLAPLR